MSFRGFERCWRPVLPRKFQETLQFRGLRVDQVARSAVMASCSRGAPWSCFGQIWSFHRLDLPSLKLTAGLPLKIMVSNRNLLFQGSIFRGYVSFRDPAQVGMFWIYLGDIHPKIAGSFLCWFMFWIYFLYPRMQFVATMKV